MNICFYLFGIFGITTYETFNLSWCFCFKQFTRVTWPFLPIFTGFLRTKVVWIRGSDCTVTKQQESSGQGSGSLGQAKSTRKQRVNPWWEVKFDLWFHLKNGRYTPNYWLVVLEHSSIFHILGIFGNNHPNWFSYFPEGLKPPSRYIDHP